VAAPERVDLARTAPGALPRRLAALHGALALDTTLILALPPGLDPAYATDLLVGAGFEPVAPLRRRRALEATVRCAFALPDYLRPRLALLVCGLNPSLLAAETGIPFGRPGNRFWPAARSAGLIDEERAPFAALDRGIGFTDLCKRPTRSADELAAAEYAAGLERLAALAQRWRPRTICLVGLAGWRRCVDARAQPGWLAQRIGRRAAYLMPSTSGRNAHGSVASLAAHLREAARL
jgi:double-stranded uracil-DNA glycosylase